MQNEEKDLLGRTKSFARRVIRLYVSLPKATVAQILGKQALRAGTSVGANYREANRARSKAEFIAKFGDCLKEADETSYWLELLVEEGIVPMRRLDIVAQRSQRARRDFCHNFKTFARGLMPFCLLHSTFCLL